MITPQDIREKTFEKAVFGGYDMATVDSFLEEIANDLALLQKENAVLKGKMKVLVDKIEEYRSNEDALRMAVLSAQKLGNSIETDARDKANIVLADARDRANTILSDARAEAARITDEVAAERRAEEVRLQETKQTSAEFIESMDRLCRRQLEFLQRVSEMDFVREYHAGKSAAAPAQPVQPAQPAVLPQAKAPAADPPEIHETVKSIEETVAKVMDEPVINVRPGMQPAMVEDERPTQSYNIITTPEDDVSKSTQFSLEDFRK